VESLIKIWQTIRSVGIALPSQSVITGRRRTSNSPESQAITAFGSFASIMLQCEYSCSNAQAEKDTKMKMMKTVRVSGENIFISLALCHFLRLTLLSAEMLNRPWKGFGACGDSIQKCAHCDHGLIDFVEDPKEINKRNKQMKKKHVKEVQKYQKQKEAEKRKNPMEDASDGNVLFV
jgi:hypothetical protein